MRITVIPSLHKSGLCLSGMRAERRVFTDPTRELASPARRSPKLRPSLPTTALSDIGLAPSERACPLPQEFCPLPQELVRSSRSPTATASEQAVAAPDQQHKKEQENPDDDADPAEEVQPQE